MNKGFIYWLRWLAVVPVAFVLALAATLLIRTVLFYTLFVFFPPHTLVESMLVPVLNAAGFVFFGAGIIPDKSKRALAIVFILCLLLIGVFVLLTLAGAEWKGYKLQSGGGAMACVLGVLGACLGVSLVDTGRKRRAKKYDGSGT